MLKPLEEFYRAAGKPLPEVGLIHGEDMPQPYKSLLVHRNDMTPTLERFFGGTIHLQVLGSRMENGLYSREVILRKDTSREAVEFGAIQIHLEQFEEAARKEILLALLPLGHILATHKVPHTSHPGAYLRLMSDDTINRVFELDRPHELFGRRNTLLNQEKKPLAEVVEILPVIPDAG